jgi:hypothetical protein
LLLTGKISPDLLRIEYFRRGQQLIAINNRGLAALSLAGLKPTRTQERIPSANELRRLKERPVAGGVLPSRSIAVTPSQSNHQILRIVTLPP